MDDHKKRTFLRQRYTTAILIKLYCLYNMNLVKLAFTTDFEPGNGVWPLTMPLLALPLKRSHCTKPSLFRSRSLCRHATPLPPYVVRTPRKWKLKPKWMICGNKCGSISIRLWGGALRDDTKNSCEADYTKHVVHGFSSSLLNRFSSVPSFLK